MKGKLALTVLFICLFISTLVYAEDNAKKLLNESIDLVNQATRLESSDYFKAVTLYLTAFNNLETIISKYSNSEIAKNLITSKIKVDNLTYREFKTKKLTQLWEKIEGKKDPLIFALFLTSKMTSEQNRTIILKDIAKAYYKRGDEEKALLLLDLALNTGTKIKSKLKNRTIFSVIETYNELNHYDIAFEKLGLLKDNYLKSGILIKMADKAYENGDYEKATTFIKKAYEFALNSGYTKKNINLVKMIDVLLKWKKYDNLDEIVNNITRHVEKHRSLIKIATKFAEDKLYDKALKYIEKIKYEGDKGIALAKVAYQFYRKGRKSEAKKLILKAYELRTQIIPKMDKLKFYIKLIPVLEILGETDKASQIMKEFTSIILSKSNSIYFDVPDYYIELGKEYLEQHRKDKAMEFFDLAITKMPPKLKIESKIFDLLDLAKIYREIGEKEKSIKTLDKAYQISKNVTKYSRKYNFLLYIAEAYKELNEIPKVDEILKIVYDSAIKTKKNSQLSNMFVFNKLAKIQSEIGEYEQAFQSAAQIVEPSYRLSTYSTVSIAMAQNEKKLNEKLELLLDRLFKKLIIGS